MIEGGTGDDLLIGDSAVDGPPPFADSNGTNDDVIRGGGGNDTLAGVSGDDTLDGGAGLGGPRDAVIRGGTGNDQLWGNFGGDFIWGEAGIDYVNGDNPVTDPPPPRPEFEDGPDRCSGGTGNNTVVNCETIRP